MVNGVGSLNLYFRFLTKLYKILQIMRLGYLKVINAVQ